MSRMSSLNNAAQIFAGACVRTSADTGTDKQHMCIFGQAVDGAIYPYVRNYTTSGHKHFIITSIMR